MTPVQSARIVVIEDQPAHLDYLASLLRRCGYTVDAFASARAALDHIQRGAPSLVITEVFMREMDGFEVLRDLKRVSPNLPIIAVSGAGPQDRSLFLDAMKLLGARAGFAKPLELASLLDAIDRLTGTEAPAAAGGNRPSAR